MAKSKRNSFIFYHDWLSVFEDIPPKEILSLLSDMVSFSSGSDKRSITDPMVLGAFSVIKSKMKSDKKYYDEICSKRAEYGVKGGRPPKAKKP